MGRLVGLRGSRLGSFYVLQESPKFWRVLAKKNRGLDCCPRLMVMAKLISTG